MATQRLSKRFSTLKKSRKFRDRARQSKESKRLHLEKLEDRQMMALVPPVILPNSGVLLNNGDTMTVAPREINFEFNDLLDPTTIAAGIQLTASGKDGVFDPPNTPGSNDIVVIPGFIGLGDDGRQVVMRFASPLPDDTYRIDILPALEDAAGNAFNGGEVHTVDFRLDLGAQIIAVVPQPVRRLTNGTLDMTDANGVSTRNKIVVYFNDDDLVDGNGPNGAENPQFYKLYVTRNTLDPADDVEYTPTSVEYDPATDQAVLTFSQFPAFEQFGGDDGSRDPSKSFRLRIGTTEERRVQTTTERLEANDPGSSFATAFDVGLAVTAGPQGASAQFAQTVFDPTNVLQWPGDGTDPGHRDIPAEDHYLNGPGDAPGIRTAFYNFQNPFGVIPDGIGGGQLAPNLITEEQKQRTREIFDLYTRYSGIQFIESADSGMTIATGDLRVLNTPSGPGGAIGVAGGGLGGTAIMDNAETWNDQYGIGSSPAGFSWFDTAMHEIGHLLGLGHTYDLSAHTIQGEDGTLIFNSPGPEPIFPGDNDIVHIRNLFRPESKDIDMYKLVLDGAGVFTAEVFAERLPNASSLDTHLAIYREDVNGNRELIARNDDYFSKDSFIQLDLEAGTYYVGVTASGNHSYDPTIEDSGIGGTTEGNYEVKFDFRKNASSTLVDEVTPADPDPAPEIPDTLNVAFDGDADGQAGGTYNFWFRSAAPRGAELPGKARTLFVDTLAPLSNSTLLTAGSLVTPFKEIDQALAAAQPYDIVRIIGNGGADTLSDNEAYHIGFSNLGPGLDDGTSLNVPKNVTVMIEAGTILQLFRSYISVGSTAPSVAADRSGGALQVLGTPDNPVYFTSNNEGANGIGRDENPSTAPTDAGDWGGISFKTDLDRADGRFVHEEVGVFLNYVNHANIRYGGGQVNVDSSVEIITPIYMTDARPTISHNVITRSTGAAMSANPDSFEETNFQAPKYWPAFSNLATYNPSGVAAPNPSISYTVDYDRVGPDIHGNILVERQPDGTLISNTTNGLFIRTRTPAGDVLEELTVAGRFNDTDIVHVIQENLSIRGTPSGPTLEQVAPPVDLVVSSSVAAATGASGFAIGTVLDYKVVYVDLLGNEGLASETIRVTVRDPLLQNPAPPNPDTQAWVQLENLTIPSGEFVGRRLYRRLGVPVTTLTEGGPFGNELQRVSLQGTPAGGFFTLTFSGQTTLPIPATATAAQVQSALIALGAIGNTDVLVTGGQGGPWTIEFRNFLGFRDVPQITGAAEEFTLVDLLPAQLTTFVDRNAPRSGELQRLRVLPAPGAITRPRLDGALVIDPAIVIKSDGARIDVGIGANLLAEGLDGLEVIFTSLHDDRYGGGGTFDNNSDDQQFPTDPVEAEPAPADWGGIFFGPNSKGSIDQALIAYAGGLNRIQGTFAGFNAVEIHEADARLSQIEFEFNDVGAGGQAVADRFGRGANAPGVIFVRGAQPVIIDNIIHDNAAAFININVNALNSDRVVDLGRQVGLIARKPGHLDNNGPLIDDNRMVDNAVNGLIVRGGTLTTEVVWDDTDIVHVLFDAINVPDFHTFGGLRLESSPIESLVVKSQGDTAGITATGRPLEIDDRIGGIVQILGQPGFPVYLTSFTDDSVGAGFTPDGFPQTDTNGDGVGGGGGGGGPTFPPGPEVNNGTLIDNDVATATVGHFEVRPVAGGAVRQSGVTVQGNTTTFVNQDYVFDFNNFIDIGSNGGGIDLGTTTVTMAPTLVSDDLVVSEGTFVGDNGQTISWHVETRLDDGEGIVFNTLTFTSTAPLGNVRFINYLDEDVQGISDDILWQSGTPGQSNFRLFTLDGPERIGFAQGGIYQPSTGLVNATWDGWAADAFPDLVGIIGGAGTTYSVQGNIDTSDLVPFVDPTLGAVHGPEDITTAMAWTVDPAATTATITTFLELVPADPVSVGNPGEWQGITIDQWAHDRNVEVVQEIESPTGDGLANATPARAQVMGALAPHEKAGDETLRLGFTINGLISKPSDVDVYSFTGKAGTEVWIDIDRTWHALDPVVELIDNLGNVLARSQDSTSETLGDGAPDNIGRRMQKTPPYQGEDYYTTNPRDPGMRLILPGPTGSTNTYHVRIRSNAGASVVEAIQGGSAAVVEVVQGGLNGAITLMLAGGPAFTTEIQGNSGLVTEVVKGGNTLATEVVVGGAGSNEVQRITAPGGGMTLTFDGQTTAVLSSGSTADQVRLALEALSNIAPGDVIVTGVPGGPWDVEFTGVYADQDVVEIAVNSQEIQQVALQGSPTGGSFVLSAFAGFTTPIPFDAPAAAVEAALQAILPFGTVNVVGADGGPWDVTFGGALSGTDIPPIEIFVDEVQSFTLPGNPTGGTFTLTYDNETTAALPFNATAGDVEDALELLMGIGANNVDVQELTPDVFTVTFIIGRGNTDALPLTGASNEVQQITSPVPGGGLTLAYDGEVTALIPASADGAAVQAALEDLDNIEVGDISVTGPVGGPYEVEFTGPLANQNVATIAILDVQVMQANAATVTTQTQGNSGQNEVQVVSLLGAPVGGTFTLTFNGQTTAAIPYNATAGQVDARLEALSNIGFNNINVAGGLGGPWTVTFINARGNVNQAQLVPRSNEFQRVVPVPGTSLSLSFNGQVTGPIASTATAAEVRLALEALSNINVGDVAVTGAAGGPWDVEFRGAYAGQDVPAMGIGQDEIQIVTAPPAGTFTLSFNGQTTTAIAFNASASTVEDALEALTNIGANNVVVTGPDGGPWNVRFVAALGQRDVAPLTTNVNEFQRITLRGAPVGGSFTLTFNGQTTAAIPFNATPSAVQAALEALNNIAPGDINVTGPVGGPYLVEFRGAIYGNTNPPAIQANTDALVAGLTEGGYQAQIRLREVDELAGTTVRYATIRYAENGIRVLGQPTHSPLAGEHTETQGNNDVSGNSQVLGNLLNSDRSALAVAGNISGVADVDWYRMTVQYDGTQGTSAEDWWSTIFDIDYADGMARPNMVINVFDAATGNLVLSSRDSNVADDRPTPLNTADVADLDRGSVGGADSWIGPAELPQGDYLVAIAGDNRMPTDLQQFTNGSSTSMVRLEPINSVQRVVEDHFGGPGSNVDTQIVNFITGNSLVPWNLHDVTLFVTQDTSADNRTRLFTVDPFSGSVETQITEFGRNIGDIAMHPRGRLYTYSVFGDAGDNNRFSDAQTGNYIQIDTGTGALTPIGDDTIATYEQDPTAAQASPVLANVVPGPARVGEGIHFRAIDIGYWPSGPSFVGTDRYFGLAVGGRDELLNIPPDPRNDPRNDLQNILYAFNPDSGVASSLATDRSGVGLLGGAGTQIIERGILDTLIDSVPQGTVDAISVVEATFVDTVTGDTTFQIMDDYPLGTNQPEIPPPPYPEPTTFRVRNGPPGPFNPGTLFEFDAGPEALLNINPTVANRHIRDGQGFNANFTKVEFDTGPIVFVQSGGNITNFPPTSTLEITDVDPDPLNVGVGSRSPMTLTFEFVATPTTPTTIPGAIPIAVNGNPSPIQMADRIVAAINAQGPAQGFTTVAVPLASDRRRISLTNGTSPTINPNDDSNALFTLVQPSVASTPGAVGVAAGSVAVRIEETSLQSELNTTFSRVNAGINPSGTMPFNTQVGVSGPVGAPNQVTIGFDGNRLNLSGATTILNVGLGANVFRIPGSLGDTTSPGAVPVPFLAEDTQATIALRMATALQNNGFPAAQPTATAVIVPGSTVVTADTPLAAAAQATGGMITGLASINQTLYAVDDNGGLFRVINERGFNARLDFINSATELVGIEFSSLSAGPRHVEGGRYENILFGIDIDGELYAFNTQGVLQPIFTSAFDPISGLVVPQTSVQTGLTSVNGLAFSNLDYNLWHVTPPANRGGDAGHGILPVHDRSRIPRAGGASAYFGFESVARNNVGDDQHYAPVAGTNTYDLPGGAHGTIESTTFSLKGYSSADNPVLYYNYFLATEGADHNPDVPRFMRDSFRVFISGDDGIWHPLATNNPVRYPGFADDELDPAPLRVKEEFDNTNRWRQARIPLGNFAGLDNLKIRFDFSTAGSMNVGDYVHLNGIANTPTNGDELRAIDAIYMRDQHTFTLDGPDFARRFEFDLGYTLVAPSGATIVDNNNAQFTVDGTGFEFDLNGVVTPGFIPVPYLQTDSPAQVAQRINAAIVSAGVSPTQIIGNRVNLRGGGPGAVFGATVVTAANLPVNFIEGAPGVAPGNIRIDIHSNMTRAEVHLAMVQVMAGVYTGGDMSMIKRHNEIIRLIGYRWVGQNAGPFQDPLNSRVLGVTTALPGDEFGAFNVSSQQNGALNSSFPGALRGQNNGIEGVYIDDIIIGFAERGEMATGATGDTGFSPNPQAIAGNVLAGSYQLEVRRAPEAGVPNPFPPPDLLLLPQIDTNDRLRLGRAMELPDGANISDGRIFSLSDGINTLTFEFNDATLAGSGVVPGRVRIDYRPNDTDGTVAQRVVRAINSPPVQAVLKIAAQLADGTLVPATGNLPIGSTTNRVNFLGDISIPNPGSGMTGLTALPTGGEVDNGTLIDNDVPTAAVGHFQVQPTAGGDISTSGVTVQGNSQVFINQNYIFQYTTFIDLGPDGGAFSLASTNVTTAPFLVPGSPDHVRSAGNFVGLNGAAVNWQADTRINDGTEIVSTTIAFDSLEPLGDIRLINYLDEDVQGVSDDLLYQFGTPGQPNFRLFTLDNIERVGFSQGGIYVPTPGLLANATYTGWAADRYNDLQNAILGAGTTYSIVGNIDTTDLPPFNDSRLGIVHGLADVTTAMAWRVDPDANTAIITTLLELLPIDSSGAFTFLQFDEQYGDRNRFRDQGQILLVGNEVSHSAGWGILVDNGTRAAADGNTPHQGPARALREPNTQRLVPGVVITNNVVHRNATGAILYSGDGGLDSVVPFGRIVNNTVYGNGGTLTGGSQTDVGIQVDNGAGPTLMNNIVANFNLGVNVVGPVSLQQTVLGGMLYQGNDTHANVPLGGNGDFPIVLNDTDPLFVNPATNNFYLKSLSQAIDSSVDSLLDRPGLVTVKNPLGISVSPILSPDRDGLGQLRKNDPAVSTPDGFGLNPFKDRGAIDRVDFNGPNSILINPQDNDGLGVDLDPSSTVVVLKNQIVRDFTIRLLDQFDPNGPAEGSDIDDTTVDLSKIRVEKLTPAGPVLLVERSDYTFSYDSTNNLIRLTPLGGLWPLSTTYRLTLDNSAATGITDRAGNILVPNQADGSHIYTIFLGSAVDWGDAPDTYGTLLATGGANHQIVGGIHLGASNGADTDGQPPPLSDGSDDGVTFGNLQPGGGTNSSDVTVVSAAVGKLDAWFDLDQNGDFLGADEYVLQDVDLAVGSQVINFTLPAGMRGDTWARFRMSTDGFNSPVGPAPDGEVEDYPVTFVGPAFQNGTLNVDVTGDGNVAPIDALLVINYLNAWGPIVEGNGFFNIPLPPRTPEFDDPVPVLDPTGAGVPNQARYIDVDGDGFLTAGDAIAVINWLNNPPPPPPAPAAPFVAPGEGEAEGEFGSFAPMAAGFAASSGSEATSGSEGQSPAASGLLSASLLVSPSIIIEERVAGSTDDRSHTLVDQNEAGGLDLWFAATDSGNHGELVADVLGGKDDDSEGFGPLDEPSWDDLLDELALDVDGSQRPAKQVG